ncbi:hypothetical protein EVAR_32843_1 [Eumeta japonica]|uniref:Uncharacterized protein n=1 Tax=Eumeta variegata TaxID=151549 RepID=A0A4C1WBK3_EUMVA|nr:hypothetical protein EVAR_32843_1 [Eumeta japonica]
MCGGEDDKINDVCELMKDGRLDILCVNETNRKDIFVLLGKREEFWDHVRDILVKCDRNERILMLDDFNGRGGGKAGWIKESPRKAEFERIKVDKLPDHNVKDEHAERLKDSLVKSISSN